jgi:hypothetical protein
MQLHGGHINARSDGLGKGGEFIAVCSGLMKPDTDLGENARRSEVSDEQATLFAGIARRRPFRHLIAVKFLMRKS